MGALVAVLAASKRPVTKEDGRHVAEQLKAAQTDWRAVDSPVKAVRDATSLVCRFLRLMEQTGWTYDYSELEDIRRVVLGAASKRRSPPWEKYGSILAE